MHGTGSDPRFQAPIVRARLTLLSQPVGAGQRDVDLMYKIVGGFHVINLDVDIGLNRTDYEFAAKVGSVGMMGRMFPWWMRAVPRRVPMDGDAVIASQRTAGAAKTALST